MRGCRNVAGPAGLGRSAIDANPPSVSAPSLNAQVVRTVIAAVAAVAINLSIYGIAIAAGVSLIVPAPDGGTPTRLPIGAIVAASVVGVAMAGLLLGLLRRFASAQATTGFVVAVAVFTVLSLISGPLSLDTSTANKLVMGSMHIVTATCAIVVLLWRVPTST